MTVQRERSIRPEPLAPSTSVRPAAAGGVPVVEVLLWVVVVLAGAGLRLLALDSFPLTALEGRSAYQAWSFAGGRVPPEWPGSLAGAGEALLVKLFGADDAIVRLWPAIGGALLIAALWLLRPWIGRRVALFAALLAALSPVLVLDARSAAGDSWGALLGILLWALVLRFLDLPRPRLFIVLWAVFFLGLGTDAVFVGLAVLLGGWLALRAVAYRDERVLGAWAVLQSHRDWLISAAPMSLAALLLVFTRFGTSPDRLRPAALLSWARAFAPQRLDVPWHYLPDALVGYELPILVLGIVGASLLWWRRQECTFYAGSLLLGAAAGALVLTAFMASRDPSTLVIAVLPLCLLGGVALDRLSRVAERWQPDPVDGLLAAAITISLGYTVVTSLAYSVGADASATLPLAGLLVAAVCAAGALARAHYEGLGVAFLTLSALLICGLVFEVRGAGAVAFVGGDEFLSGRRTTPEAVAQARLLEQNSGGVSTVTEEALPALAWYLRDTAASGGHGGARIVDSSRQVPAGFHPIGSPALLSRTWSARSFDLEGMLAWWLGRKAWGPVADVRGQLVVRDQ